MKNRKIILKVGGSLLFDNDLNIKYELIKKFAEILQNATNVIGIVVGGGKIARTYIKAARNLNASESICDTFGIEISRSNARLLITALKDRAFPEPITNLKETRIYSLWKKIFVAGGFVPGQSTTSVTFEIAESLQATDILILTDVEGIYDKDPNKFPNANKYDFISIKNLEKVIFGDGSESQSAAGEYRIFDAVSLQIMKRSNFDVRLINGENLQNLHQLLIEDAFDSNIGTQILLKSK